MANNKLCRSKQLFQCGGVSLYKIPHNSTCVFNWNLDNSKRVWQGNIKFFEQISTNSDSTKAETSGVSYEHRSDGDDNKFIVEPFLGSQSKLLFYNRLEEAQLEPIWGETWHIPLSQTEDSHLSLTGNTQLHMKRVNKISHDGRDTIIKTSDSDRHFKVIVQLPGSGYHPYIDEDDYDGSVVQVALGLEFRDLDQAYRFGEVLEEYDSRYGNLQRQYYYDRMMVAIKTLATIGNITTTAPQTNGTTNNQANGTTNKQTNGNMNGNGKQEIDPQSPEDITIRLSEEESNAEDEEEDDDDDDFGDFVTKVKT